jgi:hypothetical protein
MMEKRIDNVGDMMDFLSQYPREKLVVFDDEGDTFGVTLTEWNGSRLLNGEDDVEIPIAIIITH